MIHVQRRDRSYRFPPAFRNPLGVRPVPRRLQSCRSPAVLSGSTPCRTAGPVPRSLAGSADPVFLSALGLQRLLGWGGSSPVPQLTQRLLPRAAVIMVAQERSCLPRERVDPDREALAGPSICWASELCLGCERTGFERLCSSCAPAPPPQGWQGCPWETCRPSAPSEQSWRQWPCRCASVTCRARTKAVAAGAG